jgi:putative copper export protein
MNFKFTKIKTLISVIIPAIIGLYFFITEPGLILDASTSFAHMLINKFIFFMFWFVLAFVPIYVIWSLFEKKENESSLNIVGIIIGVLILLTIIVYFATKFF